MNNIKIKNLQKMEKISEKKYNYGINQINEEFDPNYVINNDEEALKGKEILKNLRKEIN